MSENKSKIAVFLPLVLLITILLLLSSCASNKYQTCAAYASIELKNELKWRK